jgi:dienelactone hydrolase
VVEREGRRVPAVLWEPDPSGPGDERGQESVPLVCVGHGGSGHKRQDFVVDLAHSFVRRHGCRVLAVDGPVHGERRATGDAPPQMVLLQFAQRWQQDPAMTDEMVADWRAAIDAVQALDDVGPGPVGWWGLSLGTILGLPLVAEEPRIEAAVLGLMGLSGPTRDRLEEAAASLRCPVLFFVQWHDELFPRDRAFALFDAISSPDRRLHAHPGGHGEVPTEALRASITFLTDRLGAPPLPAAEPR